MNVINTLEDLARLKALFQEALTICSANPLAISRSDRLYLQKIVDRLSNKAGKVQADLTAVETR